MSPGGANDKRASTVLADLMALAQRKHERHNEEHTDRDCNRPERHRDAHQEDLHHDAPHENVTMLSMSMTAARSSSCRLEPVTPQAMSPPEDEAAFTRKSLAT